VLWVYFQKGGIMMYPIFICSVIALMVTIERFIFISRTKKTSEILFEETIEMIKNNDIDGAIELCKNKSDSISENIIKAGLDNLKRTDVAVKEIIENASTHEFPKVERFLPLLGTMVAVSPMFGLLGTVVGMIQSAEALAKLAGRNPSDLIAGISVALITTAYGLIVAIPSLLFYNYLVHRAQDVIAFISKRTDEITDLLVNKNFIKK